MTDKKEEDKPEESTDFLSLFNVYWVETFEVFIVLVFFKVIGNKDIKIEEIIKSSLLIGFVILIIGMYNKELRRLVKMGVMTSVGSKLVNFDS
jgi:hypothetical protein